MEQNNLKQGKTTEKNGEHLKEEEGGDSLQSWITINVEKESQQKEHSTAGKFAGKDQSESYF